MNFQNRGLSWLFVGLFIVGFFAATSVFSAELVTRIQAVQLGVETNSPANVLSTADGRVYAASEPSVVAILEAATESRRPVRLELDADENAILSARAVSEQEARLYQDDLSVAQDQGVEKLLFPIPSDYSPTIYQSSAEVERLFDSLTTRTRGSSQCFQRANYWAHGLWNSYGTRSMKVFLFFTEAYRALKPPRGKPTHHWWFHVAPMVYQEMPNGEIEERVLDRGWPATITAPQNLKDWSDVFVDTLRRCRVISSYQAVLDGQAEWRRDSRRVQREAYSRDHCLLRIVPMYVYQPGDVESYDLEGAHPSSWSRYSLENHRCAVDFCW